MHLVTDEMSALSNTLTAWTPEMYGTTSPKKLELDRALIQMISNDMQPILIVEDDGFVNFCQAMNPKYLLPSRNVISKTLIPAMFEEVERKLGQKLVQAKWVCFTTDLWTSANTTGFLALTIHFWDHEASALQCFVLDCLRIWGRHTADRLGEEMRTVLIRNEIISKVVVGVTDNGAIIVKALQNINIKQMACYAHTLNLVANVSLRETPALAAAKETASRLVELTKRSTPTLERFEQIQRNQGFRTVKKLIQDISKRWNSTFEMMNRLVELKGPVSELLPEPGMSSTVGVVDSTTWKALHEAVDVLQPLYEATLELSVEKSTTGSKISPRSPFPD
ncbi:zinc finger BED domain-containing protein 4-like [Tigriopus californicus]|uniref:zinc finger BED domain-containing protein 4-like n=1 Tax=Tigriopus californicus TaxID=6832 RepID=UPI0027DAB4C7|nr:zinc finger BED domain-containing protein 4-like [Tigriopus californicus]